MRTLKIFHRNVTDNKGNGKIYATEYPNHINENTRTVLIETSVDIQVSKVKHGFYLKYKEYECVLPFLAYHPERLQAQLNMAIRRGVFEKSLPANV
jgi:hypothetical protein